MLTRLVGRRVTAGTLRIRQARQTAFLGRPDPLRPDLDVAIALRGAATLWKIALRPDPCLGEAYVDGRLTIEHGDLRGLLEVCFLNFRAPWVGRRLSRWNRLNRAVARAMQAAETPRRARRHVSRHYDLSNAFYRQFLDNDMQYSCAYFRCQDMTLEQAQQAKKAHIIAKLVLRPGLRILDIGCGWGGLGLTLAAQEGCDVRGISLSESQIMLARERLGETSSAHRATFVLEDYRHTAGHFDRIVSVGMLEHVGLRQFDTYFSHVARLLTEDGVAVIHAIGRMDEPGTTSRWMRQYIFPGGHIPSLSEIVSAAERAGLWITDIEILRLHYADTLRHWQDRFREQRDEVARLFDERFCRMWEFYLAASEMAFRHDGLMVFQLQLGKRIDSVPRTRDYMIGPQSPAAAQETRTSRSPSRE